MANFSYKVSKMGMTINLEAYTRFDDSSLNKSMYYVMKIYVGYLQVGDSYKDIKKVCHVFD